MLLLSAVPAAARASSAIGVAPTGQAAGAPTAQALVGQTLAHVGLAVAVPPAGAAAPAVSPVASAVATVPSTGTAGLTVSSGAPAPTDGGAAPASTTSSAGGVAPIASLPPSTAVQIAPTSDTPAVHPVPASTGAGASTARTDSGPASPPRAAGASASATSHVPAPDETPSTTTGLPVLPRDPAPSTGPLTSTAVTINSQPDAASPGGDAGPLVAMFESGQAATLAMGEQLQALLGLDGLLSPIEPIIVRAEQPLLALQPAMAELEPWFPTGLAVPGVDAPLPGIGQPSDASQGPAVTAPLGTGWPLTPTRSVSTQASPIGGAAPTIRAASRGIGRTERLLDPARYFAPTDSNATLSSADGAAETIRPAHHDSSRRRVPSRAAASAPAIVSAAPPASESLSPGTATGSASSGTGASTAALLVLMATCILAALLPGRLTLDLFPWASAFVAFRLERPG